MSEPACRSRIASQYFSHFCLLFQGRIAHKSIPVLDRGQVQGRYTCYNGGVIIERSNIILYCHLWAETVRFYEERLELPVLVRKEWFVEFLLAPHSALSVADQSRTSVRSSRGEGITVSLNVADAASTRQWLIERGLEPEPLRSIWGSSAFFLRDPEGNRLELWS